MLFTRCFIGGSFCLFFLLDSRKDGTVAKKKQKINPEFCRDDRSARLSGPACLQLLNLILTTQSSYRNKPDINSRSTVDFFNVIFLVAIYNSFFVFHSYPDHN